MGDRAPDVGGDPQGVLDRLRGPVGVLAGVWLMAAVASAIQIMPASVLTLVMDDFGIGPSTASWLVSVPFLLQLVVSIPIGYALDRVDNRLVLLAGTLVLVLANLGSWWGAVHGRFDVILGSRFLLGAGIAIVWTGGANLSGMAFTGRHRATAMGVFTTSAPFGYMVAQIVAPFFANWWSWEAGFLVLAGGSVLAFVAFVAVASEHGHGDVETDRPARGDLRAVLTHRNVWLVSLASFAAYSLNLFFNSWMPTYLAREFELTLTQAGPMTALFPAMGVVARATGGALSDRLFGGARRPVPLASFLVTAPVVVAIALLETPLLMAALLIVSGYTVQLGIGLFYTYVRELVPESVGGTAVSILSATSFLGAFSAPVVAGGLIDLTGVYLHAFGYALGLSVLGIALMLVAPEP
ncbi:MAG: nitrate/nitrite transporter [Halanaeroarchaeum sp.]